jgi:hypothetical protein
MHVGANILHLGSLGLLKVGLQHVQEGVVVSLIGARVAHHQEAVLVQAIGGLRS